MFSLKHFNVVRFKTSLKVCREAALRWRYFADFTMAVRIGAPIKMNRQKKSIPINKAITMH